MTSQSKFPRCNTYLFPDLATVRGGVGGVRGACGPAGLWDLQEPKHMVLLRMCSAARSWGVTMASEPPLNGREPASCCPNWCDAQGPRPLRWRLWRDSCDSWQQ